jgi:phospholipid transport system transporter-binding protein
MNGNGAIRREGNTVNVSGALTFQTVPDYLLQSSAWAGGPDGDLTVNLAGVTRADSAGLALLLEWLRMTRAGGRALKFTGVPEQVGKMIEVSGLTDALLGGRANAPAPDGAS